MWPKQARAAVKDMEQCIHRMRVAIRELDSDALEEIAYELSCQALALHAEMQNTGLWVGVRDAGSERIMTGDFS